MATSTRRRSGKNAQPAVNTALISRIAVPVAVLLALIVTAVGGPGIVLVMIGLLVKAFTIPPVEFTGAKTAGSSAPGPLNGPAGYEAASFATRQKWTSLKTRLTIPGRAWFSGWPLRWALVPATAAGVWMLAVPQLPEVDLLLRAFNAATAFVLVMVLGAATREHAAFQDPAPVVVLPHAKAAFAETGVTGVLKALAAGVAVAAPLGVLAWIFPVLPAASALPTVLPATVVAVAALAYSKTVTDTAWAPFRLTREGVAFWHDPSSSQSTWEAVGIKTAAPKLLAREQIGQATVDTFKAPAAEPFLVIAPKITPYFEAGTQVFVLPVQRTSADGTPVPGEHDPNHFQVVAYEPDTHLDTTDEDIDEAQLKLRVQCALAATHVPAGIPHGTVEDITLVTVPGTPAGWVVTWCGYPARTVRENARYLLESVLRAPVLVDHRMGEGGSGLLFIGVGPDSAFDPSLPFTTRMIEDIIAEDEWNDRWAQLEEKYRVNPPTPKLGMLATSTLANGSVLHKLPFVTRNGMPPGPFFNSEAQLKTVLKAPPFVCVAAFPYPKGRAGERHPQAFNLYWSEPGATIPSSPDQLAPATAGDGHLWVLAGMMNDSFRAAKLPIPEVSRAKLLTEARSPRRIWRIDLRLFDGLTVDKVRDKAEVIRQHFASEWVRVETTAVGCAMIIGTNPVRATLASPQVEKDLYALDWGQAFADAHATGANGALPELVSVTTMPRNTAVKKLEFDLPSGLQMSSVKGKAEKLGNATGNDFVEVSNVTGKAGRIQVICSETFPLPDVVNPDYDYVASVDKLKIPFATGLDGEPIIYDLKNHIHLLVVGLSGSGKSIIAQDLTTAVAAHGLELFIVDAVKGAADFRFLQPYSRAFATDYADAAATMKALYTEVEAIVKLNSAHGVSSYRNLPAEVRPTHKVLVIDEFFGHLLADQLPTKSNEPESIAAYEEAVYRNSCRSLIAAYAARILGEARSAGVTLIMLSQGLKANDLEKVPGGSNMKRNMSRLLAGKATHGDRASALRAPGNAPKLGDEVPPGRAIFESVTGAPVMVQCWYDPTEAEGNGEFVASQRPPLEPSMIIDLEPFRPVKGAVGEILDEDDDEPEVVELGSTVLELDLEELDIDLDLATPEDDDATPPTTVEDPLAPVQSLLDDLFPAEDPDPALANLFGDDEDEDDESPAAPGLRLAPSPFAGLFDGDDDEDEPAAAAAPAGAEEPADIVVDEEELAADRADAQRQQAEHTPDAKSQAVVETYAAADVAVVLDPYLVDSPAELAAVTATGAQLWWTTTPDPVLAGHGLTLPAALEAELGWGPADRLLAQLDGTGPVRRVVMVDAGLSALDEAFGLPRAEVLAGVLAEREVASMMLAPAGLLLAEAEVFRIAGWITGAAPAAEPEGPAPVGAAAETAPEELSPAPDPVLAPAPEPEEAPAERVMTEEEAAALLFAPPKTKVRDLRQRGPVKI